MKKYLTLLIICILAIFPTNIYAKSKYVTYDKDLTLNDSINNTYIALGENVSVNNVVDGIYLVLGKSLEYNSNNDYVVLFGDEIKVNGSIKDGAIFGRKITLNNVNIDRDIVIFGDKVEISGNFNSNVVVFADEVNVTNANVNKNLITFVSELDIDENTSIKGKLKYYEDTKANIKTQNVGDIVVKENKSINIDFKTSIYNRVMYLFSLLVVFSMICWLFTNKLDTLSKDIGSNFGYGALWLFFAPVVFALLMITGVGLIIGVIGLLIYIVTILLSIVVTGYQVGEFIWKKWLSKYEYRKYLVGVLGITLVYLLTIIPFVGDTVLLATLLYGCGLVIKLMLNK